MADPAYTFGTDREGALVRLDGLRTDVFDGKGWIHWQVDFESESIGAVTPERALELTGGVALDAPVAA
jgi:hypothetical protein